ELVSRSSVAVISREDVESLETSNFRFFRMQKELLSNEFNQSGCIQNDPVLHKLFEDAIAVLRLAGADDNSAAGHKISEERCQESQRQQERSRQKKRRPDKKYEKQAERMPVITKSKRRKLERIKAPVVLLRKMRGVEVPSEEEQKSSVEQMLKYINQLPSQETFQPPPLPFVSLSVDENDVKYHDLTIPIDVMEHKPDSTGRIQDCTYLSSEKDVGLWKMLVASPTNCNVFVGGLSQGVTSEILRTAFEAFVLKGEEKNHLKAHVVMDTVRQQSKGYGFVTFPCRRSTELALICMQDFEIHGHAMQLGWGQENRKEKLSNVAGVSRVIVKDQKHLSDKVFVKSNGNVISDTVYSDAVAHSSKQSSKRCLSRWDQETPKKYQRTKELTELDTTQGGPSQERCMLDACQLASLSDGQLDHSKSAANDVARFTTHIKHVLQQIRLLQVARILTSGYNYPVACEQPLCLGENRPKACSQANYPVVTPYTSVLSLDAKQVCLGLVKSAKCSYYWSSMRMHVNAIDPLILRREGKKTRQEHCLVTLRGSILQLKTVCSNLRAFGVRGHIGVFGLHYEADNSRLYVVCAKHVTESQLVNEFSVFGAAQVKLNIDLSGLSKGCAFVQFPNGKCAEKAIKELHGKVVGGMPMKVMIAEPKVRKGSRTKKSSSHM
ncbi:unnamed protein product, partial [Porites evermanni]